MITLMLRYKGRGREKQSRREGIDMEGGNRMINMQTSSLIIKKCRFNYLLNITRPPETHTEKTNKLKRANFNFT